MLSAFLICPLLFHTPCKKLETIRINSNKNKKRVAFPKKGKDSYKYRTDILTYNITTVTTLSLLTRKRQDCPAKEKGRNTL